MERRNFLKSSGLVVAGAGFQIHPFPVRETKTSEIKFTPALNAYSFNRWLMDGTTDVDGLFRFAHEAGITAVDLTAYYIPGYPEVPPDEVLFEIRKKAFRYGLALSGTGIRNDFTLEGRQAHRDQIEWVKRWIVAASKLGAPHIRLFDGRGEEVQDREKTMARVIGAFRECAEFGATRGVVVNYQNHFDFIKETPEILQVMEQVPSQWFGLMLDIGSVAGSDPYGEIERLIPYATSWQVKERIRDGDRMVPTDFPRLMQLVTERSYRGYFPLETLGEGDPREKVKKLYREMQDALAALPGTPSSTG